MIRLLLLCFVLPKQEQRQKTEKTENCGLFFSVLETGVQVKTQMTKLPPGLDPAMERGPASDVGRILQMERDH